MKSVPEVEKLVADLKAQGNVLSDIAWQAALACVGDPYVFGACGEKCTPKKRCQYGTKFYLKGHKTIVTKCKALSWNAEKGVCNVTGNCSGCKWNLPVWMFDCRGFTRKILSLVFDWTLKGSGATSQWNTESNWKAKGEVSDGIPSNVIVCLFYYKKDKYGRRTKTLEHTGFYYNSETCECSNGVQHSRTLNKKWEVWGIPACVTESGDIPMPSPAYNTKPMLRRGNKGEYVTLAQTMLLNKGYDLGKCGVDGDFGKATEAAVKAFQKDNGLKADGIVGTSTWNALERISDSTLYTVHIPFLTKTKAEAIMAQYSGSWMTNE